MLRGCSGFSSNSVIRLSSSVITRDLVFHRHRHNRDSHVSIVLLMEIEHHLVIHLVNMVSGKNQHIIRIVGVDVVQILVYGVRRPRVPLAVRTLLIRRKNGDAAHIAVEIQGIPIPICVFRRSGWYWVRTPTVSTPELMQLLKGKSIIRYFPPKDTAGFATFAVNTPRRLPCPPARSMAIISFLIT